MKLVVFGATGRTGLHLVKQALDAGHQVVAFVRDPAKMPVMHDHLTLIQGDVMKASDVEKAIPPDADAVISVLSPAKGSPGDMLSVAVNNILNVMHRRGIKRLIFMTGAGVAVPEDKPTLVNQVIKFALKILAGDVLRQSELAVRKIQNSGLDWTIVRVPMLNDNPYSGQYRVGWVGVNTGTRVSRADAADFILKQLSSNSYLHKAPLISD
jgi:putative NADH-flavin reductase